MSNDYPNFTPEQKKPGDPIRSRDWNAAMQAIVDLGRALRNKTNDILAGPLTVQSSLTVQGTVNATRFVGDGSGLTGIQTNGGSQWTNAANGAIHYASGNVGIGTSQPSEKLEVHGTVQANRFALGGEGTKFWADPTGVVVNGIMQVTRLVTDGTRATVSRTAAGGGKATRAVNLGLVGQWTAQQGSVNGVYVAGNYAYLAVDKIGLAIVDISDPGNPRQVGEGGYASLDTRSVRVAGHYAYLATQMGLDIFDIANVAIPRQVGAVRLQATTQDIYVAGPYAYLATADKGLQIIDISNPAAPQAIGQGAPTIGSGQGVYVAGAYAYVATRDKGLQIVNISDPANPQPIGVGLNTVGSAQGVYVAGPYAYVATRDQGLQIVDISDPAAPQRIGEGATAIGAAQGVYVAGLYAYVATSDNGLQIVNIEKPMDPRLWSIGGSGAAQAIFVDGRYAYAAVGAAGFQIIDIAVAEIFAARIGAVAANVLSVSANATVDNNLYVRSGLNVGPGGIKSDGTVTAARFVGDGSGLTGLPATSSGGSSPWTSAANGAISYTGGNVGIGTTSPTSALHVGREKSVRFELDVNQKLSLGGHGAFEIDAPDIVGGRLVVTDGGSVGIGVPSPAEKLEVNGTVKATKFVGDGSGLTGMQTVSSQWTSAANGVIYYSDGNVGIGTTNTPYKLTVSAPSTHLLLRREATESGGGKQLFLELLQNDPENRVPEVHPSIRFHHNNKFWHRIEARGDGFHFKEGNLNGDSLSKISAGEAFFSGNVGIGTIDPGSQKLNVQGGDIYCSGRVYARGGLLFWWGPDGNWKQLDNRSIALIPGTFAGTVVDGGPSDRRFKTDLRPLRHALEKVLQLQGTLYRWGETGLNYFTRNIAASLSAGPNATEAEDQQLWTAEREKAWQKLAGENIGLIAQDVETVVPEVVHEDAEGYKYIRYQQLTALLVEAIKEQNALLQALSRRVAALEGV